MIYGLLCFCVVIFCVNMSRSSFILYRIVKRHSRQSNVRRIWTCADNADDGSQPRDPKTVTIGTDLSVRTALR